MRAAQAICAIVILTASETARAAFAPIALTGSSFNKQIVIPQNATGLDTYTTATMDNGTGNINNTWYELGYDSAAPATGLPHAGSSVTNVSAPDHLYTLPPSYSANDAVLVCSNIPSVTIMPATTPPAYPALSFLVACGHGPVTLGVSIRHENGAVETNSIVAPDWFSYAPIAYVANGRIDVTDMTLNSVNSGNCRLYGQDITLLFPSSPVTSVTFSFPTNGGAANAVIFAVSGGTTVLNLQGNDFNTNTSSAAQVLQQWYNSSGLYNSTGWWNAANCLEAIENDIFANNDLQYLAVLTNTYNLNESGSFLDSYYDDEGWWCNAWIRAFDLTGNSNFLNMAKTIYNDITNGWDTTNTVCPGGIWWNKTHTYKNAIPNELFLLASTRLHQRTPGDGGPHSYLNWATNEWLWFQSSGLINSEYLVNDGLSGCENNGETTWTYNQGVILGGLTDFYKITGNTSYLTEAELIANAAISALSDKNGVLVEPCESNESCGGDGPQFKGIFIRYLAYLYDVTRSANYYTSLYANAHAVWFNDRNAYNQLGLHWDGPWDSADAARQSSALTAVSTLAEPITTNLLFAKGAGDPAFSHSVGAASGSLSWTCNASSAAGYMQTGPHVAYLPAGPHAAHFQAFVNTISNSAANLVQLSVMEDNGGATLAAAAIPWSAFVQAGVAQDFVLLFTNATAADPLDFQAYWNQAAGAPTFTLTDVTIDGLANWTAANLSHDVGRLDGLNGWEADPVRDPESGYLTLGPAVGGIAPGDYLANFELRVDNFNWDQSTVATISVVNVDDNTLAASQNIARNQFSTTRYQTFSLPFNAVAGAHYDFRAYWYYGPNAPRLTQRSVMLRPGPVPFFTSEVMGPATVNLNFIGTPGASVTVQGTSDFSAGNWSLVGSADIPAWLGIARVTDAPTNSQRFYRLVEP